MSWERQLARARERQQRRYGPTVVAYSSERFSSREEAALAATRTQGCTCDPELVVDGQRVTVRHDSWCVLLRRRDVS